MAWQDQANKHVTTPVVLVSIAFNSGTRYYSGDYVRTSTRCYKGKLLTLPQITGSIGDIKRTYERNKISLVFDDSDYEFRGLEDTETVSFKNRVITIWISFVEDAYATSLTLFTGNIYDWKRLDDLQFQFDCEENSHNMENEYPWNRVELTDYASADASAVGWVIPVPYGTISANGASNDGAFGHPSLALETGLLFVDTTQDAEKHLVGIQDAAITVDRVYKNGVLQTAVTHYNITSAVIGALTHTYISWVAGVRPAKEDFISCDITFGSLRPVAAIKHFLKTFCGYVDGDFNSTAYTTATTTEGNRSYDFSGALWQSKPLRQLIDEWCDAFELDIYWDKSGLLCFQYISGLVTSSAKKYDDVRHILGGFDSDPRVDQLMNKLKYGYNFHYSRTYFYNYATYENTESQTKYGASFVQFFGHYWTRTAAVAYDVASRKVIRFKDPITFDTLPMPLRTFSDNLGDFVRITHYAGRGAAGYSEKLFQIRRTQYDLDKFIDTMLLEDASNFAGNACQLGNSAVLPADWATATGAERDYCYLCNSATGQFSDGEPGKRLFD